jgi:hypothetical protein
LDAPINFVGHSFGTYLMGKGVKTYKSMRFERVYLAGSVLNESFFTKTPLIGDRIKYVRNDIATKDWPVGLLCSCIDKLGMAEDVGTGGYNGFSGVVREDIYEEIKFYAGGHGKALENANRATIAAWLLQDLGVGYDHTKTKRLLQEAEVIVSERGQFWNFASRLAPGFFIAVFVLVIYLIVMGQRPFLAISEILILMWLLNII